jgi:hypothetical protein
MRALPIFGKAFMICADSKKSMQNPLWQKSALKRRRPLRLRMLMKRKQSVFILVLFMAGTAHLWAQDGDDNAEPPTSGVQYDQMLYIKGDTNIQLNIGAFFPLFAGGFNFQHISGLTLKPGFQIGASIDVHWNNNVKMGGGIGFSTASGVNGTQAHFISLFFRAFYEFHIYSWSFPLGGSVGIQINSYGEQLAINPVIRPEVGAFYNFTSKWAAGATVVWSTTLQPVWKELGKSRVGNMLEVSLCGRYYF